VRDEDDLPEPELGDDVVKIPDLIVGRGTSRERNSRGTSV
jgi:hypothetical protein